jgi:hypothetical protein
MGLVMQKGRYYHPLNVLPEADCIADYVLNCYEFVFILFFVVPLQYSWL